MQLGKLIEFFLKKSLCILVVFFPWGNVKGDVKELRDPYKKIRKLVLKNPPLIEILAPDPELIRTQIDKVFMDYDMRLLSPRSYHLEFSWTRDCPGAAACSAGRIVGELARKPTTIPDLKVLQLNPDEFELKTVTKDLKAWVEKPHITGTAGSLFRKVVWNQAGSTYQMTLRLPKTREYLLWIRKMVSLSSNRAAKVPGSKALPLEKEK